MITIDDLQTLRDRENARHCETLAALDTVETLALCPPPLALAAPLPGAPADLVPQRSLPRRVVRRAVRALERRTQPKPAPAPARSRAPRPDSDLVARVLAAVAALQPCRPAQVDQHCQLAPNGSRYVLSKLRAAGRLVAEGSTASRRYRLPGPSAPGSFGLSGQPGRLEKAVRAALEDLPEIWSRDTLEDALTPELRAAGRQEGALADVLRKLREHGVIELHERAPGGLTTYRTGQAKP